VKPSSPLRAEAKQRDRALHGDHRAAPAATTAYRKAAVRHGIFGAIQSLTQKIVAHALVA